MHWSEISFIDARPVEIIVGLLVCATSLIKGKSLHSNEEILKAGVEKSDVPIKIIKIEKSVSYTNGKKKLSIKI